MKISIEKTEVCVFSQVKEVAQIAQPQVDIEVNGEKIPYNPTPRLLGVHLDEISTSWDTCQFWNVRQRKPYQF